MRLFQAPVGHQALLSIEDTQYISRTWHILCCYAVLYYALRLQSGQLGILMLCWFICMSKNGMQTL